MNPRAGVGLLFVGVFVGAGVRAQAATGGTIHVVWNAPPECPTGAQVEDEVGRLLASSTIGPEGLSATATVTKAPRGWAVALSTDVRGAHGSRSLTASTCEALAHATAIVLALTVDPNAKTSADNEVTPGPDASSPPPPPVMSNDAGAIEPAPPPPAPSPPEASAIALGANVVGAVGALPGLAFAPELTGTWIPRGWRLELSAAYFPPVRELVDPQRGGDIRLLVGAVRGCKTWSWGAGEVGPCIGIEGGAMSGDGFGVRVPGSYDTPWFALRAGGFGSLELGNSPIWLVLSVDGEVPLARYRFALDAVGIVHQVNAVVGRASLGAEVRFQ